MTIVGATSGDTGSAAIAALRAQPNVTVVVMHPKGRTSDVQRRQMTTVLDAIVDGVRLDLADRMAALPLARIAALADQAAPALDAAAGRQTTAQMLRLMEEAKAGKVVGDVFDGTSASALVRAGLVLKWQPDTIRDMPAEWRDLFRQHKAPLFMLGLSMALLAHIPFIGLLVPTLAALSFVHYGLEALRRARGGAVVSIEGERI